MPDNLCVLAEKDTYTDAVPTVFTITTHKISYCLRPHHQSWN